MSVSIGLQQRLSFDEGDRQALELIDLCNGLGEALRPLANKLLTSFVEGKHSYVSIKARLHLLRLREQL